MSGPDERVCPYCGAPPGGVFCASCGRNLASVERLPTRAEWELTTVADDRPLADRCAEATAAFLAAMNAAGQLAAVRADALVGGDAHRASAGTSAVAPASQPRRSSSPSASGGCAPAAPIRRSTTKKGTALIPSAIAVRSSSRTSVA